MAARALTPGALGHPAAATLGRVRVATWNVNSVKQRVPRLLPWLDQRQPDIVCLQETKLADEAFEELLGSDLRNKGFEFAVHGEARWNGVAILSKVGLDDVVAGIDGAPGLPKPAALASLQAVGLHDVVRDRWPNERVFTYWDYRAGMFHKDLGMRIDLMLATGSVAKRVQAAWVDRQARKGAGPSDHAPVIVDLDDAPDGDIGPVVPPPSALAPKRGSVKLPQA